MPNMKLLSLIVQKYQLKLQVFNATDRPKLNVFRILFQIRKIFLDFIKIFNANIDEDDRCTQDDHRIMWI